jgi:hypothetical protein
MQMGLKVRYQWLQSFTIACADLRQWVRQCTATLRQFALTLTDASTDGIQN